MTVAGQNQPRAVEATDYGPGNAVVVRRAVAALLLDESGTIRDCEGATEELFGYACGELLARHVSFLLPQLENVELVKDGCLNAHLRYLCRIGACFQAVSRSGSRFPSDVSLCDLGRPGAPRLRMLVRGNQRD